MDAVSRYPIGFYTSYAMFVCQFEKVQLQDMSPSRTAKWIVEMDCGHFAEENEVKPRGEFYCYRHARISQVKRVRPVWRIKCLGCKYGRSSGTSPLLAEVGMANHQKHFPTHKIQLWEANRLVTVKVPKVLMSNLSFLPPY